MGKQIKSKDTSILERVKILRDQHAAKSQTLLEGESTLSSLLEELRSRDLEALKSGHPFEGHTNLEKRIEEIRDQIAQARCDLPLLAQAIEELGQETIPEIVNGFVEWCESHNSEAVSLGQEIVERWHELRNVIRAAHTHRNQYNAKRSEVLAEMKGFGVRNTQPLLPPSTFYPLKGSSVAIGLKRSLDVTMSAPVDNPRSAQAGILRVEDLLRDGLQEAGVRAVG